jgi:hypothetical protein
MNIEQTKRTLLGLPPRQSVFIQGKHGLGKSEVVGQVAGLMSLKLKVPFGIVDIRLGQYEVGDLTGIQRPRDRYTIRNKVFVDGSLKSEDVIVDNVAVHDVPLWFPRSMESHGFIFMDEIDRCTRDVQQWAFQAVLDYRSNFVDIPAGWWVIGAGNADQDVYNVLSLDQALYDRFLVIQFQPTVPEWLRYAEQIEVHPAILKYILKFGTDLDSPDKMDSGKRYPSRRSWVKFSKMIDHMAGIGDNPLADNDYLILLASGFLGTSVAVNFSEFVKKDYKVFAPEEILNNFPKLQEDFTKMVATDFTFYNKELVRYIKKGNIHKLTKKQNENLFEYVKTAPREIATGLWTAFRTDCPEASMAWYKQSNVFSEYIRGLLVREEGK